MNLNQLTIQSNDVKKSVQFYQSLGLKLIVLSASRYARFECPDGDSTFSIHHTDLTISPSSWIYFECDNLEKTYNDLLALGIKFEHPPKNQDWLWKEARLRDPDGHQIILYHAGENRKNPPWRLKSET